MEQPQDASPKSKIRSLLLVILTSVTAACALSLAMLYYYSPTGEYVVKNILLAPNVAEQLAEASQSGKEARELTFDRIDYQYFDPEANRFARMSLNSEQYGQVHGMLRGKSSLLDPSPDVVKQFYQKQPDRLLIKVNDPQYHRTSQQSRILQEVQFSREGDHFRIELYQESSPSQWAYYEDAGVTDRVNRSLVKK